MHGGAGDWSGRLDEGQQGCQKAAERGAAVLSEGALAAVVEAVKELESNPLFNAGRGSCLTDQGTVELDAAVMTGDLRFGAVGACPPVSSAIEAALAVYREGVHALLVGEPARTFALEHGLRALGAEDLITDRAREVYETKRSESSKPDPSLSPGTVGAVAVDDDQILAAATSTGGIAFKRAGRVGDTPLPGAGTYADDVSGVAVSATGHGESIMRTVLARLLAEEVAKGSDLAQACGSAIALVGERVSGRAGLIAVDRQGAVHASFNTQAMPSASVTG